MHDIQTDLLSYAYIESEVDAVFRAYLDTSLMEIAVARRGNEDGYWKDVADIKRQKLESRRSSSDVSPYQYWFDVRADYWSRSGGDLKKLIGALVPAAYLAILYKQAEALKSRIQHVNTLGSSDDSESPDFGGPLTEWDDDKSRPQALSTLLDKVRPSLEGSVATKPTNSLLSSRSSASRVKQKRVGLKAARASALGGKSKIAKKPKKRKSKIVKKSEKGRTRKRPPDSATPEGPTT